MTVHQSKLSTLKLVYPVLSAREALYVENNNEAKSKLEKSNLYMIGARPEGKFLNIKIDEQREHITFDFVIADKFSDPVVITIRQLPAVAQKPNVKWDVELQKEKILIIWLLDDKGCRIDLLEGFTTEKLLNDKSNGQPWISHFHLYREAYTYELLYVGIAAAEGRNSYIRLIEEGHKAKGDILANEEQRQSGALVSNEIYYFFFEVISDFVKVFDLNHDFFDEDIAQTNVAPEQIVKDAEKAFVRLLDPKYNIEKYSNYPISTDGLSSSDLNRYGYVIGENITLKTPIGSFKGGWDSAQKCISNDGDCFIVEGDEVKRFHSGIDY